jgi:hypothetical protein
MSKTKLIRKIMAEITKEVAGDTPLRERIGKLIDDHAEPTPSKANRPHRRTPGPFDPMAVYRDNPVSLQPRLEGLAVEELKDIVAEHGMDRSKLAMKWKSKDRLVDLIVTTVKSRSEKGDAFRRETPEAPKQEGSTQ